MRSRLVLKLYKRTTSLRKHPGPLTCKGSKKHMKFPALWIAREGSFGVIDEPLDNASYVGYRNGFFTGLRFFDVSGALWEVLDAVPERPFGLLDRMLNRRVGMHVRVGDPTRPPVAEIVDQLCACIDGDPGDLYDQFVSREELKARFRTSASPAEVIRHARDLGAE